MGIRGAALAAGLLALAALVDAAHASAAAAAASFCPPGA
jgi:hypothetical protein